MAKSVVCVCRNKDTEGDAMTKLEQVLNRVQRELGGQVGSFRLKGIRHRFTGRSSLVAFADGMWGGEFALKFYSDVEAAQTEFAIYRQAEVRIPHQHHHQHCSMPVLDAYGSISAKFGCSFLWRKLYCSSACHQFQGSRWSWFCHGSESIICG